MICVNVCKLHINKCFDLWIKLNVNYMTFMKLAPVHEMHVTKSI